jgi:hypothetical protein
VGLAAKKKDNSKKKYREREEWQKAKKLGRSKQEFVAETRTWKKVTA